MPRRESRTHTSIWNDEDFRALGGSAQRMYWLLYSQPNISLCGVLPYTPKRWEGFCSDDTFDTVEAALCELQWQRFILIDADTQEVLIRSFMRSDGVTPKSPKVWSPAMQQASTVLSSRIRDAIRLEVDRINGVDTPSIPHPDETSGDTDRPRAGAGASPTPTPAPTPTSGVGAPLDTPAPTPTQQISTSTFRNARGAA